MKRLALATLLLFVNGILLLYYAYAGGSGVYLAFGLLSVGLSYGVSKEHRKAIQLALIYAGANLFLSLLFLIAGNLYSAVDAGISFFIVHDIIGYVQEVYREENEDEKEKTGE